MSMRSRHLRPGLRPALALGLVVAAALTLALGAGLRPARGDVLDEGKLVISQQGRQVRLEDFKLDRHGDTLIVISASYRVGPDGPAPVADKTLMMLMGALDYALGYYSSAQVIGPDTLRRGIVIEGGDTVLTAYRERNQSGRGDRVAMPPGRLFILDPPLFTMFDLLAHNLRGKEFDRRPVNVFVLGDADSMLTVTVADVGHEVIRWGGRAVTARKLTISDENTAFVMWVAPDGRMLRLQQAQHDILVERKTPPLKRPAPARKP